MPRNGSRMDSRIDSLEGQIGAVKGDVASMKGDIASMMAMMSSQFEMLRKEFQGKQADEEHHGSAANTNPEQAKRDRGNSLNSQNSGNLQSRLPRLEFPKFSGDNPLQWIRKCSKYFAVNPMSDSEKVFTAAMYMDGSADLWYLEYVEGMGEISWEQFGRLVVDRFSNESGKNIVAQFNQLKQSADVASYTLKFEELKAFMVGENRSLKEEYFVQSYIGGLKDEISSMVEMFNPQSLSHAIKLAKKQEIQISTLGRGPKQFSKGYDSGWKKSQEETTSRVGNFSTNSADKLPIFKKLSPEEIELRRKKKQCFNCDEPYQVGHKCKKLFVIICDGEQEETELVLQEVESAEDDFQISVHALAGQLAPDTIRLQGKVGKRILTVLIDTGSTHSFLDQMAARRLGCELECTNPLLVTVADGGKLECDMRCPKFEWEMGDCRFTTTIRILKLGGCDMVIGVDLLRQLGPITFDFNDQNIKFMRDGKEMVLQGMKQEMSLKMITGKQFKRTIRKGKGSLLGCLFMVSAEKVFRDSEPPTEIQPLITKYLSIFDTPTTLPPERTHDHKVPLKPDTTPFKQTAYRYPYLQRLEIEKLVQEMLDTGIIQPSSSSFSSPVLLVKKKDGTWRFCVDYRRLNAATVKDNFPIPLVDDLLDELGSAAVFSKIDLRAGYHQIRMHETDIYKTAFVTSSGLYEFKVMPFGLTNAPATFQALMNSVFRPFLSKFVLVFFDDILVYSQTMALHLHHLEKVFQTLTENKLYAKASKCSFGQPQVEYLGHIISNRGVAADPQKIEAMVGWPRPKTLKALRGFLGLTGYYRKFVRNYGSIARPLNDLTKKGNFIWNEAAETSFNLLKQAMTSAPVLALPNFTLPFVLETDACYDGIGAVLMQHSHPIAFISKSLAPKNRGLSIYEKEFLAIILATEKWRSYLLHNQFIIRTDHQSLKFLLEQKISTPVQHKYFTKLLGFDYRIEYKKGIENKVADALSRRDQPQSECHALTTCSPVWLGEIMLSYEGDSTAEVAIAECTTTPFNMTFFQYIDGLLRFKGKIFVGSNGDMRKKLIEYMHSSGYGGHSGVNATYQRLKATFLWPEMRVAVQKLVLGCHICQLSKHEHTRTPGLLQPLPIPSQAWQHITMDFIEGLPPSNGHNTIWVIVDRFSKYSHFIALKHPFSASHIAHTFLDTVYKLHGLPHSIVSDRDRVFTSLFWKELFQLLGVQLHMSTAYHPQTDGQSERVNQCLETYLRCMCSHAPHKWKSWLPLAEFWYNTSYHTSLLLTPFEALYGYKPTPLALSTYMQPQVIGVEATIQEKTDIQTHLKRLLQQAQDRMKAAADKRRQHREFQVGDWVYLKLKPYKQHSLRIHKVWKLSPRYAGPFQINRRIGTVAYELALPPTAKIHPVFHVSLLKRSIHGDVAVTPSLPDFDSDGAILLQPVKVLARRLVKHNNSPRTQVLVQWAHAPEEEATWEDFQTMESKYPSLF